MVMSEALAEVVAGPILLGGLSWASVPRQGGRAFHGRGRMSVARRFAQAGASVLPGAGAIRGVERAWFMR